MIAAFEGWNDAGEAATDAVEHLLVSWKATLLATIDPEDYYDFQVNRPHVGFDSDGGRELTLAHAPASGTPRPAPTARDVVLITGHRAQPALAGVLHELLDYVERVGATTFVTLGALLADVPHTRPVPITGDLVRPGARRAPRLQPSRYTGPTGIVGVIQETCAPPRACQTLSTGPRCRTTSRSRPPRRRRWRCSGSSRT